VHDYVLLLLTGRLVTDASLASRSNLLNLESRTWDEDLIGLFGIDAAKLCDMVEPGSIIGGLLPAMAETTGLPSGLPVVSAGGDQQCAALGLGLTAPDRIVANTGTGSYLLAYSGKPVFDPEMRVFCNASALPDAYVVEAGLPASGVIYRWFRANFYGNAQEPPSDANAFDSQNTEAASSPPGARGLIFLPHFKGSGAPHFNPGARGTFHNLDLNTTRGDMGRAILEGIAAEMADNLELLEGLTRGVDWVNSSGGLSKFGLFNQIQANMYGRKVRKSEQGEATALGAWISAAKAIGLYGSIGEAASAAESGSPIEGYLPDAPAVEYYGKLRAARRALYDSLYPT
jgi:sugar (pentulose or hexulose) kinase